MSNEATNAILNPAYHYVEPTEAPAEAEVETGASEDASVPEDSAEAVESAPEPSEGDDAEE